MKKEKRLEVYQKYNGHCAYCGKELKYKDMQVDHIIPLCEFEENRDAADFIDNLNPSCRRCNHYKRSASLKVFRRLLLTLHMRLRDIYICKVAEDYGIMQIIPWDGKFYFERVGAVEHE